jgi:hypothetical protein
VITDDQIGMFAAITGDELIAGPDAVFAALSSSAEGVVIAPMHYRDWVQKPR